jgi:hypothetical protein
MPHNETGHLPDGTQVPDYFREALEDAERLLKYSAELGIDVDPETRTDVLHARAVFASGWTEDVAAKLLVALTTLAARVRPVTAASLKAYHSATRPTMRTYLTWAILLSAVIIPSSIITFLTSKISDDIRANIVQANALAVKLNSDLGSSASSDVGMTDKVTALQTFADTTRLIYARANRLNLYVFPHVELPEPLRVAASMPAPEQAKYLRDKFELPVPLDAGNLDDARVNMTKNYQDVRYYAQTIMTDIGTFYGAITVCVLPILYALLGTCAYLLRTFEDQMNARTFVPSAANSARFLIAAIGGTVIGLFGNFTQQASASPLAVAFLVGYAVEVFFSFLEGLIKAFSRSTPGSGVPAKT